MSAPIGPTVAVIGNAKPVATGGILVAPLGTVPPTDTETAVTGFVGLGYVSEDGLKPEGERNIETVRDWAGDIIAQLQTEHSSRFTFALYGVFDVEVLKVVFGEGNVSGTAPSISVVEDGEELPHLSWVFDIRSSNGKKVRIVIPDGQVTTVTEAPLVAGALQSFELTVEAFKDPTGNKVYRYYEGETVTPPTALANPQSPQQ
jgi:hypothetical protein